MNVIMNLKLLYRDPVELEVLHHHKYFVNKPQKNKVRLRMFIYCQLSFDGHLIIFILLNFIANLDGCEQSNFTILN